MIAAFTRGVSRLGGRARLLGFGALALALVTAALFAGTLCPYDPYMQRLDAALEPPSPAHILGTDRYGRDMLSRVIAGSRASIFGTLFLVAIASGAGTAVGLACAIMGGRADGILMRVSELFLAFPGLVLALAMAGVAGGGPLAAVFALAAASWPKYARLARSQTLSVREAPFLAAARLAGCSGTRLAVRHILPNIAGPLLVTAALDIGTMMMELAGLSFLGLGARPPVAEWGSMMSEARGMMQTAPWTVLAPGVAIFAAVMVFNLLGDALRDCLDPKAGR